MRLILVFFILLTSVALTAQSVPFTINYQAIARDGMGKPLPNADIDVSIAILAGTPTGTVVFSENHISGTNNFGLYYLTIGSKGGDLSAVDWSADAYFIETTLRVNNGAPLSSVAPINSVPYSFLAQRAVEDAVEDADSDPENEIQFLMLDGTVLSLTNGNAVDLTDLIIAGTDDQEITDLSLSGTTLTITIENGNSRTIDLAPILPTPSTDDQSLELNGTELSIEDGNTIDLAPILPPSGTDDQTLTLTNNTLTIEDGNSVDLSTVQDGTGTDDQELQLNGTELSIEDGNAIDLAPILPPGGTDDQTLTLVGNTLAIEDGNNVDLSTVQDGTGTDDQELQLNGTELSIEDGNAIDLAPILPPGGTDDQTLTLVGNTLAIEDGNNVDLSTLQDGTGTDDQSLELNGTELSIEDGNAIDLAPILPPGGTDDQTLTLTNNTLAIEDGNNVDLSTLQDGTGTDDQELQLNGTELSIEDGNAIDLAPILPPVGTDDQTLILTGNTLEIEDGNNVDLSTLQDGTGTDDQELTLANNILTIEDGNSVDMSALQDGTGTDDQTLTLTGNTLSIEDGNSVNLSSLQDGTIDADADPTNEIQGLELDGDTLRIVPNAGNQSIVLPNSIWQFETDNQGIFNDNGVVNIKTTAGDTLISMTTENSGKIQLYSDQFDGALATIEGTTENAGALRLYGANNTTNTLLTHPGGSPNQGVIALFDENGTLKTRYDANNGNSGSSMNFYDNAGIQKLRISANETGNTGSIEIYNDANNRAASLRSSILGNNGSLTLYDNNIPRARLFSNFNSGGTGYLELLHLTSFNAVEMGTNAAGRTFWELSTDAGLPRLLGYVDENDQVGRMITYGQNGNLNVTISRSASNVNYGGIGVYNATTTDGGTPQASFIIDDNGHGQLILRNSAANDFDVGSIYYDGIFGWTVEADIKNFVMEHPEDETQQIVYASLEGPEAAAYERGTTELINGEAFVPFSEHFQLVINPETMTVSLTPHSTNTYGLAVIEKTAEGIRVKELMDGHSDFTFDWEVKAVRRGYESYQAVRPRRAAPKIAAKIKAANSIPSKDQK